MSSTTSGGKIGSELTEVPVDEIVPGRHQPREVFDSSGIKDLASSIEQHGVLEPLLARKVSGEWELIAGERRLRAAKEAGLSKVPVRVLEVDNERAAAIALSENLDREDLSPIEEARGLARLKEVLEEAGKSASQRRLRDLTSYSLGNVSELLKVAREITENVTETAGVSPEQLREIPRSSLLHIASENSLEDKADLLRRAVKAEHPTLVTSSLKERQKRDRRRKENRGQPSTEEAPEQASNSARPDDLWEMDSSDTGVRFEVTRPVRQLSAQEAESVIRALEPLLRSVLEKLPASKRRGLLGDVGGDEAKGE